MATAERAETLFVVVICTRDRGPQLLETLDALEAQSGPAFSIVVVDQSAQTAPEVRARADAQPGLRLIHDNGRGLSRARNVACRSTTEEWLVFVDDDCIVAADFVATLERVLREHPEADFITPHVGGRTLDPRPDDLPFSTFPIEEERTFSGRWVHPGRVGFGVCMLVRRTAIDRLGGWDERLGPGAPDFPAADDMDFNWRLLRGGGVVHHAPQIRARHDQWRTRDEVVALYAGYMAAWMGMTVKTMRTGDPLGGLWLWWGAGPRFLVQMFASGLRRRSSFRMRVAARSTLTLLTGTWRAARRSW